MNLQEQALRSRTGGGRIFVLDALRGLAAFTVVLHHFHYAVRGAGTDRWYLRPFIAGHESVMLFFVLSGYVLSVPVWRGKQLPYGLYVVRRLCRIYLPYVAALFLSAVVGRHFLFSHLPLNAWFYLTWQEPITWRVIAAGLLMSTSPTLNTAFWSLHYEMLMSLVFPFLCLVISKLRSGGSILLVMILNAAAHLLEHRNYDPLLMAESMRYCAFFMTGALLAKNQEILTEIWGRLGLVLKISVGLLSLGLYFHFLTARTTGLVGGESTVALGVVGIIIVATSSKRVQRHLDKPVFEYLGRVSYSMYLIHAVILFALIDLLYGKLPIAAIGLIYLPITMVLSHLFLITVEEPSLRLGKRLTSGRASKLHSPVAT